MLRTMGLCSLALAAAAVGAIGPAEAQVQSEVPLNHVNDRLGVTIGVNGGQAVQYLFDTGSDQFNVAVGAGASPAWFLNYTGPTAPSALQFYPYGNSTYGYLYSPTSIKSIQFAAPAQGPEVQGTATYSAPQGLGYTVGAAVYQVMTQAAGARFNVTLSPTVIVNPSLLTPPGPFYSDITWANNVAARTPPEEGQFYGTFGAGDFGNSILGSLTTAGYVVEANGRDNTPGACGASCLVIGLTPELRAQFFSIVPWSSTSTSTFPFSGAPAGEQYGVVLKYVLGSAASSSSVQLATLLDTGHSSNELNSSPFLAAQTALENVSKVGGSQYANGGLTFGVTGAAEGAQTVTTTTAAVTPDPTNGSATSENWPSVVQLADTPTPIPPAPATPTAIAGLGFYLQNAVMYDLQNQTIGYTPFYISVDSFAGLDVSAQMGPVGIAGVIYGGNGVTVEANAAAYLTAANTYTGVTEVARTGWLGVGGPGGIAASSNVNVDGWLDIYHSSNAQQIRSLSGSGIVILGPNTLVLTNASGNFSGQIANFYWVEPGANTASYPEPTASPNGYGGVIIAGGLETFSGDDVYGGPTGVGQAGGLILTGKLENSMVENAGYFQNDGTTGQLTVSTGTVAGNGVFAGGLLATSGQVAPGDPGQTTPGHMTVGGFLTLAPGATYLVSTTGGAASRIDVNGQATISGATLAAVIGSPDAVCDPRRELFDPDRHCWRERPVRDVEQQSRLCDG